MKGENAFAKQEDEMPMKAQSNPLRSRSRALQGFGILASSLVPLAIILLGCAGADPTAAIPSATKVTPVKAVQLAQTEVERTTTQPATIHAFQRAEIRANVTGYVEERTGDIGDVVDAGDLLAVIAIPELNKRRLIQEARIARHEAHEKQAEAGIRLAEAELRAMVAKLAQAQAEQDRAEATLAAAKAEFDRTEDLVERQSLQSRMLDEVRMQLDSQQANVDAVTSAILAAEADVAVSEAKLSSAKSDLVAASADTLVARTELEELDATIGYATIRAPFAGVVTERSIEVGDLVRRDSEVGVGQALYVISQIDRLRVHIPLPEVDAAYLKRGDAVTLSFPFFANEPPLFATVTRDSGSLDRQSRTLLVEAELDNPGRKLLPGMFGQATIRLGAKIAAGTLPARVIRFDEAGKAFVYVIESDSTVSVVNIDTGIDDGETIEVVAGLEPGQRVIDAHLRRFRNGDRIEVLNMAD